MRNKVHYIITVLLTITCVYLTYQQIGIKKYLEIQTEILNKQSELNNAQEKVNTAQENLNQTVYEHIKVLYER